MDLLIFVILVFIFLESLNVVAMFFKPETKLGNSVGIFSAWHTIKPDSDVHDVANYLVYWVAGCKFIVICVLTAVMWVGDAKTIWVVGMGMMVSISLYFVKMFPILRKMDKEGKLEIRHHSVTLSLMVLGYVMTFAIALLTSNPF